MWHELRLVFALVLASAFCGLQVCDLPEAHAQAIGNIVALPETPFVIPISVAGSQRKSVTDLTTAELMSVRRGVTRMMARNSAPRGSADYRRSWVYWANMHSHFGNDCF